jgi:hypothetical protein
MAHVVSRETQWRTPAGASKLRCCRVDQGKIGACPRRSAITLDAENDYRSNHVGIVSNTLDSDAARKLESRCVPLD